MPVSTTDFLNVASIGATVSAAELQSLVTLAEPYTDKGMVIVTTDNGSGDPDIPAAGTTTKWKRYIWLRVSKASEALVSAYVWNPNDTYSLAHPGGPTTTNWTPIAAALIGASSITTGMLDDGSVTYAKIASDNIKGIKTANINDGQITAAKMAVALPNATIICDSVGVVEFEERTILSMGEPVYANNGMMPIWRDGYGFKMEATTAPKQRIITQTVEVNIATTGNIANITGATNAALYNATGVLGLTDLDLTFARKYVPNHVKLQAYVPVHATAATNVFLGLYKATGATAPVAVTMLYLAASAVGQLVLEYTDTDAASGIYYLAIGATAGATSNVKVNTSDGSTRLFATAAAVFTAEEYA